MASPISSLSTPLSPSSANKLPLCVPPAGFNTSGSYFVIRKNTYPQEIQETIKSKLYTIVGNPEIRSFLHTYLYFVMSTMQAAILNSELYFQINLKDGIVLIGDEIIMQVALDELRESVPNFTQRLATPASLPFLKEAKTFEKIDICNHLAKFTLPLTPVQHYTLSGGTLFDPRADELDDPTHVVSADVTPSPDKAAAASSPREPSALPSMITPPRSSPFSGPFYLFTHATSAEQLRNLATESFDDDHMFDAAWTIAILDIAHKILTKDDFFFAQCNHKNRFVMYATLPTMQMIQKALEQQLPSMKEELDLPPELAHILGACTHLNSQPEGNFSIEFTYS